MKISNKKKVLKITFILEIIALITHYLLYILKYSFSSFIASLKNEKPEWKHIYKFTEIFNDYYDNVVAFHGLEKMIFLGIMIVTIISLCHFTYVQLTGSREGKICSQCCYICYFCASAVYYAVITLYENCLINVPKEEIYVFSDELNKEIKKNLIIMLIRKIILILCTLIYIVGGVTQIILSILNNRKYENPDSNKDIKMQPIRNFQENNVTIQIEK